MLTQLSEPLVFRAYYRIGGTGKTGLADVTATVYGPSGAVLVSAQAATEIGGGLYQYILSGSYTVIAGAYTALFSTANAAVNTQQLAAEWLVGDNWLQSIDAAISSRLAATGYSAPNNSGIGSIIATLGSAGAGLTGIPSIPGIATATGVAAVLTAVNALTNQGARSGPVVPSVFVRPTSGSVAYVGYIRVWASGGSAEDPDSNALTIHAADRVGGNLDGHLASTSMARIQAGLYSFSYTVQSTDTSQPIYFFFSWTSSGVAITDGASTVVQDAEETSALAAIIATLGTPATTIAGDMAALPTAAAIATAVWSAGTRTLSAFGFTVASTIADKTGFSLSTSGVQAIWDALLTALTTTGSIGKKLADWVVNADTSGTTTILTRLTDNRAGYLDNLSAGAVAQAASLPANFATLGISSSGKINEVTLVDTTTTLTNAPSGGLDEAGIRTAVGLASANLDTQIAALGGAIPGPAPSADSIVQHLLDVDTTGHTAPNSPAVLWRSSGGAQDVMAKLPSDYADGQLGRLIGKLDVGTPTEPVYVLPSPPVAADKCRVVGYFTGVSMQIPIDSTVLFELVTTDDSPAKSSRIVVGRTVSASLNVDGILTDGTNLWLDLERNDTLSPSGSHWRVTFADARLTRKSFQLNDSVFDLATLVT